jgi:hypothetical protein
MTAKTFVCSGSPELLKGEWRRLDVSVKWMGLAMVSFNIHLKRLKKIIKKLSQCKQPQVRSKTTRALTTTVRNERGGGYALTKMVLTFTTYESNENNVKRTKYAQ